MLTLRRAELQSQIAADTARLRGVEARLHLIEREGAMPTDDIQIKALPAVRVAELTGTAASFEPQSITPVIQPLYDELVRRLDQAGVTPVGPAIAYYENVPDGDGVVVHATLPVNVEATGSTTSPSLTFPQSSRRQRSSTAVRWTTSCRPSRRWRTGSTPTATAPSA